MKRITLLSIILFVVFIIQAASPALVKTSIISENFESATAPWGFASAAQLTTSIAPGISPNSTNALQWVFASATGSRTSTKQLNSGSDIVIPADGVVKLDFEWQLGVPTNKNTSGIFLRFKDSSGNTVIAFSTESTQGATGNALHYVNLDNTITENATSATTRIVPTGGNFVRNSWVSIHASLNYITKKVDTLIVTNGTATYTDYNRDFYSTSATGLAIFELFAKRDGSNMGWTGQLDNFNIYYYEEVSALSSVTINYLDPSDNPFQDSRIATNNPVGSTYTALNSDKVTVVTGGFYYVYDSANTTSDNVIVKDDGTATINLKFKKNPVIAGNYTWTGISSANWNEAETNFSTDGINSVGYQSGNGVIFDATGTNKAVVLNNEYNLGNNNVTISSDGYSISGTGKLTGTGKVVLNLLASETTTLNITNELTGGVEVNGINSTVVIAKDAAATMITLDHHTTLNLLTGSAFNKPINVLGTAYIIPTSNVTYSSVITGGEFIQYRLSSPGSVTTSGTFSGLPILNNIFGGEISVLPNDGSSATMFGSTNNFTNNKLYLGDNVSMVYPVNPASDGSTTISIGELTGTSTSKLMGPRLRTVTYNVGGLSNNTFEGVIENFPADAWTNIPIINFTKIGTGELQLSGLSTNYVAGTVNVNGGTLSVSGTLGATSVPVIVGAEGRLYGNGTVSGPTTVNGTLEGSLNFGSSLTLSGTATTKFIVNGILDGEFDKINVVGEANVGGAFDITVNIAAGVKGVDKVRNANPPVGTRIKLINAGSIVTSLTPIHYPSIGWTFVPASGELVYDPENKVTGLVNNSDAFRIYPTLTRDNVNVEGNVSAIEVINLAGQKVKQVQANGSKTVVNMNNLSAGAYFVKAMMVDGSVNVQNVILQK